MAEGGAARDPDVCIVGAGAVGGVMARRAGPTRARGASSWRPARGTSFARAASTSGETSRHQNPWRTPLCGAGPSHRGAAAAVPRSRGSGRAGSAAARCTGKATRCDSTPAISACARSTGSPRTGPSPTRTSSPTTGSPRGRSASPAPSDEPWASPRSTPFPLPPFAFSYSDAAVHPRVPDLGIGLHHLPQARNSVAYAGRSRCRACGTCQVCPTGAKASTDLTHIPDAEATGNARVHHRRHRPEARGRRVRRVSAAVYARPDKAGTAAGRADLFVLAGGGVETARLLLLSASSEFPAGLANRSGHVGKFFMSHPVHRLSGARAEKVYPYRIGFSTAIVTPVRDRARARHAGRLLPRVPERRGADAGADRRPSGLSGAGASPARPRAVRPSRRASACTASNCLPREQCMSLARGREDYFGNPVPHIACGIGRYEQSTLSEAQEVASKILTARGSAPRTADAQNAEAGPTSWARTGWAPIRAQRRRREPSCPRRAQPLPGRGRLLRHRQLGLSDPHHRRPGDPGGGAHRVARAERRGGARLGRRARHAGTALRTIGTRPRNRAPDHGST